MGISWFEWVEQGEKNEQGMGECVGNGGRGSIPGDGPGRTREREPGSGPLQLYSFCHAPPERHAVPSSSPR